MAEKIILKNTEIAQYVHDGLCDLGYREDFHDILDSIDVGRQEKEEKQKLTLEEAEKLKKDFLDGFVMKEEGK